MPTQLKCNTLSVSNAMATISGTPGWSRPPKPAAPCVAASPLANCMWTLVSDLWNGLRGDGGYDACMSTADSVDHGKPNIKSECAVSVENVVLRGSGPNGALTFGPGSPQACSVLLCSSRATCN